jgi:hypothetical protein
MTLYAAFEGEVRCEPLAQEGGWRISGRARGLPPAVAGEPLQLLLNGARDLDPPAVLHDAELEVVDAVTGASARLGAVLRGRGYGRAFSLRSAQVQLGASPALLALMAPPPAPRTMRVLAWLLLNLVRIPGVASLVARARADHGGG